MPKYYLLVLFAAFSVGLSAQPVNDDCAGIVDLGEVPYCSAPAQYTNVDATASDIDPVFNIPACFSSGGVQRDVWFQFSIPADGSIVDVTVAVTGNENGNGTLENPQVAVYRGDCAYGELSELDCASAPNGTNSISLDLFGLTPGFTYFIRVNDYSATASPNAGTFQLCVNEYVAEVNMGQVPSTSSCSGTLYDSGGALGDYQSSENLSFVVCPQDFHQCIIFNVESYEVENNFDFITFYQGNSTAGVQVTEITGTGNNFEVQISGTCATIGFTSDGSVNDAGFKMTWSCSPNPCTTPPLVTCDDPVNIPTLPFDSGNLSNCFSGNSIPADPCNSGFIQGNDYVFTYTSPGDECITVQASGTNSNAGVGVYSDCPTAAGATCIAVNGGFGASNPSVSAAFLENPGTYYIVFATNGSCSPFELLVDTVTCPVLLPPASTCDAALNIGGCSTTTPEIIALNPGSGDPNFLVDGVNQGCFVIPQFNYSFFYFQAGSDGKFAFTVEAADPAEASDIDLNVWGPIDSFEDICAYTSSNQPARSTWAPFAIPTGLQDIHPTTGITVLDDYDCGDPATPGAGGDNFVRALDVVQGKFYVVLLDDFGQAIESGGISISFDGTTAGVLSGNVAPIAAGPDTTVCIGQSVQLNATGGAAYYWGNNPSLSCSNCSDPIASPTVSTTYEVQIAATCGTEPRSVVVKVFDIELGPDAVACAGAEFQINENPSPDASYSWVGTGLSCSDCPTPTLSGLLPGSYSYFGTLTTPFCTLYDTLEVTILPGTQPQYEIISDTVVCAGQSVSLGGAVQSGTSYNWTSVPSGFNSTDPNPTVNPLQTTTFYLSATNGDCQVPALDSVTVTVQSIPQISVSNDTTICQGSPVQLSSLQPQAGVTYQWVPSIGEMAQPSVPNTTEFPSVSTTYELSATLGICTVTETIAVEVTTIEILLSVPDSLRICQGETVNILATTAPAGTIVTWTPTANLQIGAGGFVASTTPLETASYTATVAVPGCVRNATVYIAVDSIPSNLAIHPADTSICLGTKVLLTSSLYDPAEYQYMKFLWTPFDGQLTPDSLFNMVVQPGESVVYTRYTQNGACNDTSSVNITVIIPPNLEIIPADTTLCALTPLQLSVLVPPGVDSIEWSPSGSLSCTECLDPIATLSQSTQFTVTGEYMGCPTGTTAQVNIVSPPPIQFPNDLVLCAGESITLNLTADPTATYSWSSNNPAFPSSNLPQPTITPTQTATYNLVATNGCIATGSITVQVVDAQLTVSPDTALCRFQPVSLTAMGTLPGSYLWSNGSTMQTINVTSDSTRTYTVTYIYGDGCSKEEEVTVAVNGESVVLELPMNPTLCPGESITLNQASVPSGAVYIWEAMPSDPTLAQTAGNPTVSPSQTTMYTVNTILGGCPSSGMVIVNVATGSLDPTPDQTICQGTTVELDAGASMGMLAWSTGEGTPSISVSPMDTTTYVVTLLFGPGCSVTDSTTVFVEPTFDLSIVAAPPGPEVELGEELELTATITPAINLNAYSYEWLENGTVDLGSTRIITTTVSTKADSIFYKIIATSPNGCIQEEVIGFNVVQPVVEIPNAFTPDGDEVNNLFRPVVLKGNIILEKLEIYNRWGQRIFSASPNTPYWDGNVDGKPAPVDTYLYQMVWRTTDGAMQAPRTGEVTLLR